MFLFSLIAAASGSVNNEKSNGDNGHTCLVPLCKVNGIEIYLLVITEAVGE